MLKKPCLHIFVKKPESFSGGYYGKIKFGFRYWSKLNNSWAHYADYEWKDCQYRHCLANLYAVTTFYGDSSPDEVKVPYFQYENLYSLGNPDLTGAMTRTLRVLHQKIQMVSWDNPKKYSDYLKEIAKFYRIDQVIFASDNNPVPLEEGLAKADELVWKLINQLQIRDGRISQAEYVRDWCTRYGYKDPQCAGHDMWYAISPEPNCFMPVPIDVNLEL